MRVVFLDIDGVLATSSSYKKVRPIVASDGQLSWSEPPMIPRLAANVQHLCDTAGAGIVVSSSWRGHHPLPDLVSWFQGVGLTAPVIGATPVLDSNRGSEIEAWVVANGLSTEDFLILEDEEDVRPYRARQVATSFYGPHQGFSDRHLRRALRLWGLAPPGRRAQVPTDAGTRT